MEGTERRFILCFVNKLKLYGFLLKNNKNSSIGLNTSKSYDVVMGVSITTSQAIHLPLKQ